MQFNPDKNKQARQVIFSQKRDKSAHPLIYFNQSEVILKHEQKHLGMILDSEHCLCLREEQIVRCLILRIVNFFFLICKQNGTITQVAAIIMAHLYSYALFTSKLFTYGLVS